MKGVVLVLIVVIIGSVLYSSVEARRDTATTAKPAPKTTPKPRPKPKPTTPKPKPKPKPTTTTTTTPKPKPKPTTTTTTTPKPKPKPTTTTAAPKPPSELRPLLKARYGNNSTTPKSYSEKLLGRDATRRSTAMPKITTNGTKTSTLRQSTENPRTPPDLQILRGPNLVILVSGAAPKIESILKNIIIPKSYDSQGNSDRRKGLAAKENATKIGGMGG